MARGSHPEVCYTDQTARGRNGCLLNLVQHRDAFSPRRFLSFGMTATKIIWLVQSFMSKRKPDDGGLHSMLRAFRHRNFRLYFGGQSISLYWHVVWIQ